MKIIFASAILGLVVPSLSFGQTKDYPLQMSLDDRFVVRESDKWNVAIEKALMLRFANVRISPKDGRSFSLMLYFKCDTPDLAQFDSLEKMEAGVLSSSKPYLPHCVEKEVKIKRLNINGWYGFSTVLTDRELADQDEIPAGKFKYLTRGMVRLSPDSVLGFSLMTNELDSVQYKEKMDYICGFVKAKK